jgi:hypothetical protein
VGRALLGGAVDDEVVEDLIGPDILVWTSTFFIKEPASPTFAAWHQDGAYFGLAPHDYTRRYEIAAKSDTLAAQEGIRRFVAEMEARRDH